MAPLAFPLVFFLALAVRYLPELRAHLRNRGRQTVRVSDCRVKSWQIALLWGGIVAGTGYRLVAAPPPLSARAALGMSIFLGGIALGLAACRALGNSYSVDLVLYPESRLITTGIFARVRHPLRLGLGLEMLGAILLSGAWVLLPVWVAAVFGLMRRTRAEEEMLREYFGAAAERYRNTVPAVPFGPRGSRQA